MIDQDIYNIAEWLVYNRDDVLLTIGNVDNKQLKVNVVDTLLLKFPEYNVDDIYVAFEDERVLLVFDFYYIKKIRENEKVH